MLTVRITNFIANTLTVLAVLILLAALLLWVAHRPYFQIERVALESTQGETLHYVQIEELAHDIQGKVSCGFFVINLVYVRSVFYLLYWVIRHIVIHDWFNRLL